MKYTVENKKRTRTLTVKHGWHLGLGYYQDERTCTYKAWCVLADGKFFCEARSESAAKQICTVLNNDEATTCNRTSQAALSCQS